MPVVDPYATLSDADVSASPTTGIMRAAALRQQQQVQNFQQEQELRAAQEQRAQASSALAQAHDAHLVAQDKTAADTHAMANDLGQWQDPATPQYRVPFDQAPPEVRQHVQTAFPGVASAAPAVWNAAYTANTGNAVTTRAPATAAQKIAAQKAGVAVDPTDSADDIVAKMADRQANPLPPAPLTDLEQKMAEQIANYDVPPNQAFARGGPNIDRQRILSAATDMGYDAKEFPNRLAARRDFTSGKSAQSITSLNTVIHHLGNALESYKQMGNTGMGPFVNAPMNTVRRGFGNSDISAYQTNADAVAEEMAKLLKGGVATKSEIDQWKENLSANLAPKQLQANINEMMKLIAGRVDGLRNQWQSAYNRPRELPFLDINAKKVLSDHGFDPGAIDQGYAPPGTQLRAGTGGEPGQSGQVLPPAATPQIPTVNSQQEYDALPSGAQYRDSNGKTARKK